MTTIVLPHFHIMDSSGWDEFDWTCKTWESAVQRLRQAKRDIDDYDLIIDGTATEGAYYFYKKRTNWIGSPIPREEIVDNVDWDFMLSIYTCTGEQPCPCNEGEE